MSTLGSFLPAPKYAAPAAEKTAPEPASTSTVLQRTVKIIPAYGARTGYLPRHASDFGDGGAFPEIHIAQYPLDMGRDKTAQTSTTVALQVDESGNLRYDALARHGHSADTVIHSQYKDLVPIDIPHDAAELWAKPSEEEVAETTEKTRKALEKIVTGKVAAAKPKTIASTAQAGAPVFVKYTPTQTGGRQGKTRIIKMVEMPVDPFEPPKFGFKRLPPGPPSPPPPVMHSPPRKLTKEERDDWKIPPCISNWKNAKGYTIPLDKRLAADGRGLVQAVMNDKFALFSEALQIAERHSREEVRQRALVQQKLSEKERALKEQEMRAQAQQAREVRAGMAPRRGEDGDEEEDEDDIDGDDEAVREREAIRRDKQRQLQREYRMSHMGADAKAQHAKMLSDRDISEKVALGVAQPTMSKETMFDSRLYNQSEGLGTGFAGDDEAYNVYDKPLFNDARNALSSAYRPKASGDDELYGGDASAAYDKLSRTDRFMPAPGKGFSGASSAAPRDGPVEFEPATTYSSTAASSSAPGADLFGVREFMSQAQQGSSKSRGHDRDDDSDAGDGARKRSRHY
ncbi:mRNA splicing protein [Allomyces arbusculus]|nr:mRNA splicing protein [Allomyces arbusculus]